MAHLPPEYSQVLIKQVGPNKRVGLKIYKSVGHFLNLVFNVVSETVRYLLSIAETWLKVNHDDGDLSKDIGLQAMYSQSNLLPETISSHCEYLKFNQFCTQ